MGDHRLNPLKSENLIILSDPQRMIRAGARAVDGWAKENGFTVLFCSGNLAVRESTRTYGMTRPLRSSWWTEPETRRQVPSLPRSGSPLQVEGEAHDHLAGLPDRDDR